MPFIAQCPHCRNAKVQAPSRKQGTMHTCPKCAATFPLEPWVETNLPVEYKLPPVDFDLNEAYRESPADSFAEARTEVHRPMDVATSATPSEVMPLPASIPAPAVIETDYTPEVTRLEPSLVLVFAAGGVFGLAMLLTQITYGRLIAIPFLLLGGLLGFLALPGLAERRKYGWAAIAVNVVGLLFVTLMPDWLGAGTWLPLADPNAGPKPVMAVSHTGEKTAGEWIDAKNAVWQQDDVRFGIVSVKLVPLDAAAKQSSKSVLRIMLRLSNVGVAREILFSGWSGEAIPKLTVANGPLVTFHKMESAAAGVKPGKDMEIVLVFDLPPSIGELKLELPAIAFPGTDAVKFTIPAAMITREK